MCSWFSHLSLDPLEHAPASPSLANRLWDRLGVVLSLLCALHCLLAPVVLALLPLWPAFFRWNAWIHPLLSLLLVPVTYAGMRFAYRRGNTDRVIVFGAGLVLIILAWLLIDWIGEAGEIILTLCGSGMLVYAHWRNWRTRDLATA